MTEPQFSKVTVVTGAGRGIGAAIAKVLGECGAHVAVNDISSDSCQQTADEMARAGNSVISVQADIGRVPEVHNLFEHVLSWRGKVDILVCSAGISSSQSLFDTDIYDWNRVLQTNLTGSFLCAQAAMRLMKDGSRGGKVIFIGSGVTHQGGVTENCAYAASKGGVHALAKTLARSGAPHKITVNVVAPGPIPSSCGVLTRRTRSHRLQPRSLWEWVRLKI